MLNDFLGSLTSSGLELTSPVRVELGIHPFDMQIIGIDKRDMLFLKILNQIMSSYSGCGKS